MRILVATTTIGYKCDGLNELSWLKNAEEMFAEGFIRNHDLTFFAALQLDGRGLQPFGALIDELNKVKGKFWTFTYDDGAEEITTNNRVSRICAGRNMITEYGVRPNAESFEPFEWILFLDSDMEVPADTIEKLLEVDWPIVGGEVPNYCLSGADVVNHPARVWLENNDIWPKQRAHWNAPFGFPVQQHWNTAGFLMVHRSLFRKLRWRVDPDAGQTDDPAYGTDALNMGWPTLVRKDLIGTHPPFAGSGNVDRKIY